MPDSTQSLALREQRTSFNPAIREIETLAILQRPQAWDEDAILDLVFVMDDTGSMGSYLDLMANVLSDVAENLSGWYSSVKYALITFKDDAQIISGTPGNELVNLATCQGLLSSLEPGGGDDTPENGFGALLAASQIEFREDSIRVFIICTDAESHERSATFQDAKKYILDNSIYLFLASQSLDAADSYGGIVTPSGGSIISTMDEAAFTAEMSFKINGIIQSAEPPIYLVNDNVNFPATLETGEAVTFLKRSFAINPTNSGEDGALSISLTIDNTDFAISRFIARAKLNKLPIEVNYRIYLSNDSSGPENNPPLVLFAADAETKGNVVSTSLRWLDIQNAPFPDAYYTFRNCPSL